MPSFGCDADSIRAASPAALDVVSDTSISSTCSTPRTELRCQVVAQWLVWHGANCRGFVWTAASRALFHNPSRELCGLRRLRAVVSLSPPSPIPLSRQSNRNVVLRTYYPPKPREPLSLLLHPTALTQFVRAAHTGITQRVVSRILQLLSSFFYTCMRDCFPLIFFQLFST